MLRDQFVQLVRTQNLSVSEACRRFGISRDTGHRWLRRFDADPHAPLTDAARRPRSSPARTPQHIERLIADARAQYRWGARKIHALLARQGVEVPSVRTVHQILRRLELVRADVPQPTPPLRFERHAPNELWQVDHKCAIEIARAPRHQLTVLDDHSRYLLALRPVPDRTITAAFSVIWELMGEVGMPEAILADNAFSTTFSAPATLSWFDANLICLGIRPIHGRPYHPQTQGKVERLHGTLEREMLPFVDRATLEAYSRDVEHWRRQYNTVRPHQAIGDLPPAERWRPSPRPRPCSIPEPQYPPGSTLRTVCEVGSVRWNRRRIMAGRGLVGRSVRIVDTDHTTDVYFAHVRIRSIDHRDLTIGSML
jgi:transposase InsO family protein